MVRLQINTYTKFKLFVHLPVTCSICMCVLLQHESLQTIPMHWCFKFGFLVGILAFICHFLFYHCFTSRHVLSQFLMYIFFFSPTENLWYDVYSYSYVVCSRDLNSAVVKLTTVHVTKLPLKLKIRKICMICFEKTVLIEDLYVRIYSAKLLFSNMVYMRYIHLKGQAYS
jgi:hypothetical protein